MRLNKYIAENTNLSRRAADLAIEQGNVAINGKKAQLGAIVGPDDEVKLNGKPVNSQITSKVAVLLNKPVGYVCSKDGQGSPTVYDLLPKKYQNLNIAGRLDKDSSGLVVLTNDGDLLNKLTHPKYNKNKVYEIELDNTLKDADRKTIEHGVELEDGISKLRLQKLDKNGMKWRVIMHEGRNRQIRRTFAALHYTVTKLHRTNLAKYTLEDILLKSWKLID